MKKTLETKTAMVIVFLSITSAFLAGGMIAWLGTVYAPSYQKLITFASFIVGQSLMVIPLVCYLKYKNFPILSSIRFNAIEFRTVKYVSLFSIGMIIISDEVDRIIQIFLPAPEYIVDLNQLLRPDSFLGGCLLFIAVVILL